MQLWRVTQAALKLEALLLVKGEEEACMTLQVLRAVCFFTDYCFLVSCGLKKHSTCVHCVQLAALCTQVCVLHLHSSSQSRLREIEMSEHDADMYAKIRVKVRNQIQTLRTLLSSIEVFLDHCASSCNSACNFSPRTTKGSGFAIKLLEIQTRGRY